MSVAENKRLAKECEKQSVLSLTTYCQISLDFTHLSSQVALAMNILSNSMQDCVMEDAVEMFSEQATNKLTWQPNALTLALLHAVLPLVAQSDNIFLKRNFQTVCKKMYPNQKIPNLQIKYWRAYLLDLRKLIIEFSQVEVVCVLYSMYDVANKIPNRRPSLVSKMLNLNHTLQ